MVATNFSAAGLRNLGLRLAAGTVNTHYFFGSFLHRFASTLRLPMPNTISNLHDKLVAKPRLICVQLNFLFQLGAPENSYLVRKVLQIASLQVGIYAVLPCRQ